MFWDREYIVVLHLFGGMSVTNNHFRAVRYVVDGILGHSMVIKTNIVFLLKMLDSIITS